MKVYRIVFVRHGDSEWLEQNKFCGWYDSDLSQSGLDEAKIAGKRLRERGFTFDVAYTSVLTRAIRTLFILQDELQLHWIPVYRSWRLNERMYGALQGLNKSEMASIHGEDQVKVWRRSYDIPPPPVELTDAHWPGHDPRYAMLDKRVLPRTECLKDLEQRVLPYWFDVIVPAVKRSERVLVSAHGTTLRALVKLLDQIPDNQVQRMNIPTGIPLVYELDEDLVPISHYYLASDEEVKAGIEKVENQGKAN